jgi:hypothetical protein
MTRATLPSLLFKYEQIAAGIADLKEQRLRSFARVWHASCSLEAADQIAIAHPMGTANVCT